MKPGRRDDVLTYAGLLAVLVFFGAPLVWILSLRTQKKVLSPGLNPVPGAPTLENYAEVLRSAQFPQFLLNSVVLALIGSVGAMLVAAPATYAFSRMDFRGRRALLVGVLALQMISPLVVALPLYRYFASRGLLDSRFATGLIYVAVLTPLATWTLKGFFDGIPRELDDAARIDGASRLRAFRSVVLPVARSGLTAVFVLTAILAAGGVLAILPAIVLFVVLQRFIVGVFVSGALKG